MDLRTKNKYKKREKIIKAMAHASRLLIIDTLAKKEKCVSELVELIGVDASTVSKHLSVLKNAGIVSDDKRGLNVYYSLKFPCIISYLNCIEESIK